MFPDVSSLTISLSLLISLYSWATGDWGACSRSCGGGQQTRTLRCLRKVTYQREEVVAHSLCPVISPAQVQPCHTQACPPEWSTGSWSQVSLKKNLKPDGHTSSMWLTEFCLAVNKTLMLDF